MSKPNMKAGMMPRILNSSEVRAQKSASRCYPFLGIPASRVFACDMLENRLYEIPVTDGHFTYTFTPFEIAIFLVEA
jgi:hypothetical protein